MNDTKENNIKMSILGLISYLLGAAFSVALAIIKIFLVVIIGVIAGLKKYNPWLWGIATLLLPWPCPILILFVLLCLPVKLPKLPKTIRHQPAFQGKNSVIASIMALCAMIAKADGNVTKEEIHFMKEFVVKHFGISKEELNTYSEAFNYGKSHPEAYLEFVSVIKEHYAMRRDIIMVLSYLFVGIALQEGESTAIKEEQTRKIIMALGLNEYEYQALRVAILSQNGSFEDYTTGYGGYTQDGGYQNEAQLIKKYTQVLGVSEDASLSEIKKAYRKLVKEYHPDKLAAGSVPQDYIDFANQKIRDINEAYEYLEKVKGGK